MKHVILVNPVSGTKKGSKYGFIIKKLLYKNNIDASIYESKEKGDLTNIVKELVKKEQCRFYSIGGDGTLNEVVTGIIGSDSEIVVLACGTGNDFIRSISKYKSLRKIILTSLTTSPTKCDVILVNNKYYCINILSVGFDSLVGRNVDKFRWVPFVNGTFKYNLSIIYTLLQNKDFNIKLRINNKIYKGLHTLVAISNGKYYGGGVCPNPNARVDDGVLDVCIIDKTSIFKKIQLLPKYKKGTHTNINLVNFEKTDKLTIASNESFPISVDGEVIYSNKLKCEIIKNKINIIHT